MGCFYVGSSHETRPRDANANFRCHLLLPVRVRIDEMKNCSLCEMRRNDLRDLDFSTVCVEMGDYDHAVDLSKELRRRRRHQQAGVQKGKWKNHVFYLRLARLVPRQR